jgi:hypothetical protein
VTQDGRTHKNESSKNLWHYPGKYCESFTITMAILIIGIIFKFLPGEKGITFPVLPFHVYRILIFTTLLLSVQPRHRESTAIIWISSISLYQNRLHLRLLSLIFIILLLCRFGINYAPSAQNSFSVHSN